MHNGQGGWTLYSCPFRTVAANIASIHRQIGRPINPILCHVRVLGEIIFHSPYEVEGNLH